MNLFKKLLSLIALVMCATAYAGPMMGTGWSPITPECGTSSISPVVIYNATSVAQTGSITIPSGLSYQVEVFSSQDSVMDSRFGQCSGRPEMVSAPEWQSNFTVQPGETVVYWLGMGGQDYNLITSSHSFGVGGLPSNTKGQSWYDFYLSLNADESFSNLNMAYSGTGGTGSTSHQNGFNVVCVMVGTNPYNSGNLAADPNCILSPYSSGTDNSQNYGYGEPIGFAWVQ